jgi:transposase-like protein
MTKSEQRRLTNWRLKVIQAATSARNVARTCRHFGISRKTFYKWKRALRRALCCLPESIETVTVVRGGLESGSPSQTFAGYKLFVTAGRVIP